MDLSEGFNECIKVLQDHIIQRNIFSYSDDTLLFSKTNEEGESVIFVGSKRSLIPFVTTYAIGVSASYAREINSSHLRELRQLKLVISNKIMTNVIFLHTRIAGKGKYPRKLYGVHRIPIEFNNCVFLPSADVETRYGTGTEIIMNNCEIVK